MDMAQNRQAARIELAMLRNGGLYEENNEENFGEKGQDQERRTAHNGSDSRRRHRRRMREQGRERRRERYNIKRTD